VVKLRGLNIEESNDDPVKVLPVLTKFDSSRVQVSTVNGLNQEFEGTNKGPRS